MTKSIRKKQKALRRRAKPGDYHAQSPGYWRRELRRRDKVKDDGKEV